MVRYSPRAFRGLAYLNRAHNDIELYVEDVTCHNMHLLIFKTILGDDVRLRTIFQVGSKLDVLALCSADQESDGRKKLYIIDGDLDLIWRKRRRNLRHLYRLRSYCVENLLLTENAVAEACMISSPDLPMAEILSNLDFDAWLDDTASSLRRLFVTYATAVALEVSFPTIAFPVVRLCRLVGGLMILDNSLVGLRIRDVTRRAIKEKGWPAYHQMWKRCRDQVAAVGQPWHTLISGKSYLFPLLQNRLTVEFGYRGNAAQLKTQLASRYVVASEVYLARRLRRAVL